MDFTNFNISDLLGRQTEVRSLSEEIPAAFGRHSCLGIMIWCRIKTNGVISPDDEPQGTCGADHLRPKEIIVTQISSTTTKFQIFGCTFSRSSSLQMSGTTIIDSAVIASYNRGPIRTAFQPPSTCLSTLTWDGAVIWGMHFGHAGTDNFDSAYFPSSYSSTYSDSAEHVKGISITVSNNYHLTQLFLLTTR